MDKKYSFWNLLRAQWSWKNDKFMVFVLFIVSISIDTLFSIYGFIANDTSLKITLLDAIVSVIEAILIYHLFKLVYSIVVCCNVTNHANKGNGDAIGLYQHMLKNKQ